VKQKTTPRKLVWLLTVLLFGSLHLAEAQQPKVYRIGVLTLHPQDRPHLQGLRDGLKKTGYVEGKNLILDIVQAKNPDELRSIAKNYADEKMDLIVTTGNTETVVAKAVWVIPIIFMPAAEPVQSGFVKSPGTSWHKSYRSRVPSRFQNIWQGSRGF
jgi:ABC-type uncharacterized transport system substrate-binding protein